MLCPTQFYPIPPTLHPFFFFVSSLGTYILHLLHTSFLFFLIPIFIFLLKPLSCLSSISIFFIVTSLIHIFFVFFSFHPFFPLCFSCHTLFYRVLSFSSIALFSHLLPLPHSTPFHWGPPPSPLIPSHDSPFK